jgi:signal transduction histidine kinase
MACISLLMPLNEYITIHDRGRLLAKLIVVIVGLPIVVALGTATLRWSARRHIAALPVVLVGAGASGVLFALLLSLARVGAFSIDLLRPNVFPVEEITVLRLGFLMGLTNFALWALVYVFPFAVEDARVRALESEKLRVEAELAHFRSHFEPHFLLNTLNAIAGLVTEDPREARRLLGLLGDLLRESLRNQGELQRLDEQLEWLRRYAHILQVRHAGQLVFHWDVQSDARRSLLPRLLLQPLVENAVKHGALMRHGGGEVTVSTHVSGDKLVCTIADNGPGMHNGETRPGAIGLESVRRRLVLRYQDDASLRLESTPEGTRSIVELPRHE